MTQFLPQNLLALFAPREPVPFLPPNDKLPHEKKRLPYGGLMEFLGGFEVRQIQMMKSPCKRSFFSFSRKRMKHHRQRESKPKKNELLEE